MKAYVLSIGDEDRAIIDSNGRFYSVMLNREIIEEFSIGRHDRIDVSGYHDIELQKGTGAITSFIDQLYGEGRHVLPKGLITELVLSEARKTFGPYFDTMRLHTIGC